jgi:hypothetical protein
MTRTWLIAGVALALAACADDSSRPTASGKGTIQAINAVKGSPNITFLIEERDLGSIEYKTGSSAARYDDLEYNFNFNARFPGEIQSRRIASVPRKIEVGRQYTFVPTGDLAAPDVLVWEGDEPAFEQDATVFAIRFAHLAQPLGALDVYLDPPGTTPVTGNAIGTLETFGELLPPIEAEAGEYVVTLTSAGDPADVVYQSSTAVLNAQVAYIAPLFEGDEQDTAPYNLRLIASNGLSSSLPDSRFPPTIRFIQASFDLPPADIYADEMLTDQLAANHLFGEATGDIPAAAGDYGAYYTPAGSTGAVLFEDDFDLSRGAHNQVILHGTQGNRETIQYIPDRRAIETQARFRVFHGATNHPEVDFYFVPAGESVADSNPDSLLQYSSLSAPAAVAPGSYDLFATVTGEKAIVAGPFRLDLELGDSREVLLLDATDTAAAEFVIVPEP